MISSLGDAQIYAFFRNFQVVISLLEIKNKNSKKKENDWYHERKLKVIVRGKKNKYKVVILVLQNSQNLDTWKFTIKVFMMCKIAQINKLVYYPLHVIVIVPEI